MLPDIRESLIALVNCDLSIYEIDRQYLVRAIKHAAMFPGTKHPLRPPRILSRHEAAKMFGVTPRCIDLWSAQGKFPKVRFPGSRKAIGYRESDLLDLLNS